MKQLAISALTAIVVAGSFVLVAAKAQDLPMVLESLWRFSAQLSYDPLLVATIMLTFVLVVGKSLDMVRTYNERRHSHVE